jgi:hypothetical protein
MLITLEQNFPCPTNLFILEMNFDFKVLAKIHLK